MALLQNYENAVTPAEAGVQKSLTQLHGLKNKVI
jgi:hypothetical protein